jgi:hypothetical protein
MNGNVVIIGDDLSRIKYYESFFKRYTGDVWTFGDSFLDVFNDLLCRINIAFLLRKDSKRAKRFRRYLDELKKDLIGEFKTIKNDDLLEIVTEADKNYSKIYLLGIPLEKPYLGDLQKLLQQNLNLASKVIFVGNDTKVEMNIQEKIAIKKEAKKSIEVETVPGIITDKSSEVKKETESKLIELTYLCSVIAKKIHEKELPVFYRCYIINVLVNMLGLDEGDFDTFHETFERFKNGEIDSPEQQQEPPEESA